MKALVKTNFNFPDQRDRYQGKVRDVYSLGDELLVMVATDRISAFDVVLPEGIPYKGQVLNQIANRFLDLTEDIVPNWKMACPDPMVTIGRRATPFKVEMVIRGFLTGHAWRTYQSGERQLCGIELPDGMRENEAFTEPIITPTTKADQGQHDQDISRAEILEQGIVSEEDYTALERYTRQLFHRGQEFAMKRGLLLVDTKYEFGKTADGEIILIDEIHTPDSSRYFYAESYQNNLRHGLPQKQLSKEFVRQWLISNGFQGKEGQEVPSMSSHWVNEISQRYIELYEQITGLSFQYQETEELESRIEQNVVHFLKTLS